MTDEHSSDDFPLFQLHWQSIFDGSKLTFKAQASWADVGKTHEGLRKWVDEVNERHPLPKGMQWCLMEWDGDDDNRPHGFAVEARLVQSPITCKD